jgi:exopolysaccharide biosynthesis polyprenyl glycosylphosphotransferase
VPSWRPAPRPPREPKAGLVQTSIPPLGALRRDTVFRRLLALADVGAASVGFLSLLAIGGVAGIRPAGLAMVLVIVLVAKLLGLYDRDELVLHKSTLDEVPRLFYLVSLYTLMVWLLHRALIDGKVDSPQMLGFWGSTFGAIVAGRWIAREGARRLTPPERCLIVGPSAARLRFGSKLVQADARIQVVGYLPLADERRMQKTWTGPERRREDRQIGDLDRLMAEGEIHRVVILPGSVDGETLLDAMGRAKAAGVKVSIVPRMFEIVGSSVEFDDLEGLTVLGVRRFGLTRSSAILKRGGDLVGVTVLLALLAPLLVLTALAIKLTSRGPVFFRQTRVGREGRTFRMLKFRSMIDGADRQREALAHLNEADGLFKIGADPRVTAVGRVLRRMSLDELPQLLHVLRGEMSLVGPRPLVLEEDQNVRGHGRRRLHLSPGMTGPWQILGPVRVSLAEMATIDYLYGANWSLWNDIKILVRTIAHVLSRRGV